MFVISLTIGIIRARTQLVKCLTCIRMPIFLIHFCESFVFCGLVYLISHVFLSKPTHFIGIAESIFTKNAFIIHKNASFFPLCGLFALCRSRARAPCAEKGRKKIWKSGASAAGNAAVCQFFINPFRIIDGICAQCQAPRPRHTARFPRPASNTSAGKSRSRRKHTPWGNPPACSQIASHRRSSYAAQ